jgi:uncharacterized protein involved in response to NO
MAGMVLYAILIVVASLVVRYLDPGTGVRVVLALAPAAAIFWGMYGWFRSVRRFDELGRRIHLEAATATLAVLLATAVTYGLLQAYVGLPSPHAFFVFGLGCFVYAFGALFAQRRYR